MMRTLITEWAPSIVDIKGLGGVNFPEDPEPESVSVNEINLAVNHSPGKK